MTNATPTQQTATRPMTRDEIDGLAVGDTVAACVIGGRAGFIGPVTEISYRGTSVRGRRYVGGYVQTGEHSWISFSVSEGEDSARLIARGRL